MPRRARLFVPAKARRSPPHARPGSGAPCALEQLYARIAEVEAILKNYVIVNEADATADEVSIGSTVTLDYGDGFPEELKIVGSQESDPMNMLISDESPVGRALLGHHLGDVISYESPNGVIECKIIALA